MQVRGVEAIKATLQKAAIHRDHRDKRRTTPMQRFGQQRRISSLIRRSLVMTAILAKDSQNPRLPPFNERYSFTKSRARSLL
jgi:hypothetical protein